MSSTNVQGAGLQGVLGSSRHFSPWVSFLLRRFVFFFLSMWVILTLVFFMARSLSGDAAVAAAGLTATPEMLAAKRAELGLDKPLINQYFAFVQQLPTLNFGDSIVYKVDPLTVLAERLPNTLMLSGISFVLAMLISIPLGMWIASSTSMRGKKGSSTFNAITGLLVAIPDFLLAVALIAVFAITLKWLPPAGSDGLESLILPVITLTVGVTASTSRLVATETSRVLSEEYVRTARSMRLPKSVLYLKHILPNVLTSIATTAGLLLATMLGGTLITETVFAWPGVGSLTIDSILQRDYPMLQSSVAVIAVLALFVTLLVDILMARLDPRSLLIRS